LYDFVSHFPHKIKFGRVFLWPSLYATCHATRKNTPKGVTTTRIVVVRATITAATFDFSLLLVV
jgi:hypothetical protein